MSTARRASHWIRFILVLAVIMSAVLVAAPSFASTQVSVGDHTFVFHGVRYNFPVLGQSTWYYEVRSGDDVNAISHVVFGLCPELLIVDAGTWNHPDRDSLNSGEGSPVPYAFPASPQLQSPMDIFGLKFNEGFADGATHFYYFTVNGNYAAEDITVGVKFGRYDLTGAILGPSPLCEPIIPPAAVTVSHWGATREGDTLRFGWTTAWEQNNLGFDVFAVQPGGEWIKLNDEMIFAQGLGLEPQDYTFETTRPDIALDAVFWLRAYDLYESSEDFGPIQATVSGAQPLAGSPQASAPDSGRADVAAVIYGGWSGIPVSAWVGGTRQPTLTTAPNQEGHAAVLFSFWPSAGAAWQVRVQPELPEGLDPARWEMRLLWVQTPAGFTAPTGSTVSVGRGSRYILHYQLIDTGAAP